MVNTRRKFLESLGRLFAWAVAGIGGPLLVDSKGKELRIVQKYGRVHARDSIAPMTAVFINGKRVYPVEADDEEGWVRMVVRDKEGNLQFPLRYVKVYGDVVMKPVDEGDNELSLCPN